MRIQKQTFYGYYDVLTNVGYTGSWSKIDLELQERGAEVFTFLTLHAISAQVFATEKRCVSQCA